MTKKKKRGPTLEQQLGRPWCYYCERDFDDMMILTSHQKAKHFKCDKCGRRLNTAGGLAVHLNQVHKEQLEKVDNALENRVDPNIEIFGTEGIPEEAVLQHRQRVIQEYHEDAALRQAKTGNPQPGSKDDPRQKRPRLEDEGDLKARLKEFVAKKAGRINRNGTPGNVAQINGDVAYQNGYGQQYGGATSPAQNGGVGAPPGLPSRPSQGAPPVSNWQQMHQTQMPTEDPRLRNRAANQDPDTTMTDAPAPAPKEAAEGATEKKAKKEKPTRMIFGNADIILEPEEKMAAMSRYSFDIDAAQPVVLGKVTGNVTNPVDDDESAVGRRE